MLGVLVERLQDLHRKLHARHVMLSPRHERPERGRLEGVVQPHDIRRVLGEAAEVSRVPAQHRQLLGIVALDGVRTRCRGAGGQELVAIVALFPEVAFLVVGRHDIRIHDGKPRECGHEWRRRLLEPEHDGLRSVGRDGFELRQQVREPALQSRNPVCGVDHVLRFDRGAVVKDRVAQMERVGQPIVGNHPRLGEIRNHLTVRRSTYEKVVDVEHEHRVRVVLALVRVELANRCIIDAQHAVLPGRRAGQSHRDCAGAQQQRNGSEHVSVSSKLLIDCENTIQELPSAFTVAVSKR